MGCFSRTGRSLRRVGAGLIILSLAAPAPAQPQGPPPANVVLDSVRTDVVEQQRAATGQVLTRRRSSLAAEEAGMVSELGLEAGDRVERDQVIAKLDPTYVQIDLTRARAQVALAQARIDQRRAELSQSERDLQRLEELDARGSASESELDDGRTRVAADKATLAQALADLAVAQADVAQVEARLEEGRLRSLLEDFAESVAHDLRAPLRQIRQWTGFLREDLGSPGPEVEEVLQQLERSGSVFAEVEARLLDPRPETPTQLWGRRLARRLSVDSSRLRQATVGELEDLVARNLAREVLGLLPQRDPARAATGD